MKRYLLPSALILAFGLSLAFAQQITRSVQLSQDPTGPIGYDYSAKNTYFPGHILFNSTSTPAITSCGTAPAITGNDTVGRLTTGSGGVTTCTIAFTTAFNSTPSCLVMTQGSATMPTFTNTTTNIIMSVDISSTVYNYFCASVG